MGAVSLAFSDADHLEISVGESNDYSQAIFHAMLFGHYPMS